MDVTATTAAPVETTADTVALGVFEGKRIPHDLEGAPLQALLDAGEARSRFAHVAHTHAVGKRWILVGLGAREDFAPERARIAAALAHARARELGTTTLCWELPHRLADREAAGFVEGTLLAARRFDRYRRATEDRERISAHPPDADPRSADGEPPDPTALIVSDHADRSVVVARAALVTRAQNRARDLQDRAPNDLTPTVLAERARELAALGVEVEIEGRAKILARRMGAFGAVFQGSAEEPALITLRWRGPEARGPVLGFVGKGVTHDTGGYALKTKASIAGMKFDMSGAGAVLEAVAAIAELRLSVDLVAVIGATDNSIDAAAVHPGDVVHAANGLSIEVNNPDAEGRLVLADCLHHARELGAERLVDLATLTGGAITALGTVHCALFADDEPWAQQLAVASAESGELLWRMPLHPDYASQIEGRYADLDNSPGGAKAQPVLAAEFLHRFTGQTPWAHIDLTAASDLGKPYAKHGGSGWGVRLLVELATAQAAA
jgi:leucyl aminopeptidase